MKNIALVLITGFLLVACSSSDKSSQENVKLVTKYVKAVENLDYNAMDDILSDEYLGIGPSKGDSINKENAIKNWKNNVENLYENISYSKNRNISVNTPEGEWVSNWADLTITYKGSGKQVSILSNTIYQIENGKIVKSITFYNEADVLEQLGYVFINPDDL